MSAVNLIKIASNVKLCVVYVGIMICITHESQPPKYGILLQGLTFNHLFSFVSCIFFKVTTSWVCAANRMEKKRKKKKKQKTKINNTIQPTEMQVSTILDRLASGRFKEKDTVSS